MIVMSDLGNNLITQDFDASDKLLKIWLDLMTDSTKSEVMGILVFSRK